MIEETKTIKDEELNSHIHYDEFTQTVYRQLLDIGDAVEIRINGSPIKAFTVKYVNAHFHITFQDKGEKKPEEPI